MSDNIGLINENDIQNIATSIKTLTDDSSTMLISEMPNKILNVQTNSFISKIKYDNLQTYDDNNYYGIFNGVGFCLTQTAYDNLTPMDTMYYVILDETNTKAVTSVITLSLQDYQNLSSYNPSILYFIEENNTLLVAFLGTTEPEKVYLGTNLAWNKNMINLDPNDGFVDNVVLRLNNYGGYDWTSDTTFATTGYIPVVPGQSYIYSHEDAWVSGHYQTALCYYATEGGNPSNAQRNPTNFSNAAQSWTFTAPAGVAYVRLPLGKQSGGTLVACTMYLII